MRLDEDDSTETTEAWARYGVWGWDGYRHSQKTKVGCALCVVAGYCWLLLVVVVGFDFFENSCENLNEKRNQIFFRNFRRFMAEHPPKTQIDA